MIKIFTDSIASTVEKSARMFPLLRVIDQTESDIDNYFEIVDSPNQSDVIIIPFDFELMQKKYPIVLKKLKETAIKFSKQIWLYSSSDYGITVKDENIITFRFGGFNTVYDSKKTKIIPSFVADPYTKFIDGPIAAKHYTTKASIGFVGHANNSVIKLAKEFVLYVKKELETFRGKYIQDHQSFFPSSVIRYKFLKKIIDSNYFDANIIFRNRYRAGADRNNQGLRLKTTKEYFENIYDTQYTFCMRGGVNFSVRLYETFAVGRIPIYN